MKINKKNLTIVINNPMSKMIVTYQGKSLEYLINTQVEPHVADQTVASILKYYPEDVPLDFVELW
tara:strand:+ start:868 stop:1062 length:195 start_codon:yes stop_codon:yes gene_type:complete